MMLATRSAVDWYKILPMGERMMDRVFTFCG